MFDQQGAWVHTRPRASNQLAARPHEPWIILGETLFFTGIYNFSSQATSAHTITSGSRHSKTTSLITSQFQNCTTSRNQHYDNYIFKLWCCECVHEILQLQQRLSGLHICASLQSSNLFLNLNPHLDNICVASGFLVLQFSSESTRRRTASTLPSLCGSERCAFKCHQGAKAQPVHRLVNQTAQSLTENTKWLCLHLILHLFKCLFILFTYSTDDLFLSLAWG